MWFHEPERREHGQHKKVEMYNLAAPHLVASAERVEIAFESTTIPGFLRLPAGPGPHPCAVLIGGLESTKEESYHFEALCHRRGLAPSRSTVPVRGRCTSM